MPCRPWYYDCGYFIISKFGIWIRRPFRVSEAKIGEFGKSCLKEILSSDVKPKHLMQPHPSSTQFVHSDISLWERTRPLICRWRSKNCHVRSLRLQLFGGSSHENCREVGIVRCVWVRPSKKTAGSRRNPHPFIWLGHKGLQVFC